MAANKVTLNGSVLIDVSQDTASAADVAEGKTFHLASGVQATGTKADVPTVPGGRTVSFSANGAVWAVTSVGAGQSVSAPATDPAQTGLNFDGWYTAATGGVKVAFPYTPSGSVTLYAQFAAAGYTVSTSSNYSYDDWNSIGIDMTHADGSTSNANLATSPNLVLGTSVTTVVFDISGSSGGSMRYTMGGEAGEVSGGFQAFTIPLTGDMVITWAEASCLTGDTLVTLADGGEMRLDEIQVGDELLSYDWETMALVPNPVIFTDRDEGKSHVEYDLWTFDDGTSIKTVHRHEFFCVEAQGMRYMDEWRIGDHAWRLDGTTPALAAHETVRETVRHYKLTGARGTNYFANGLLNGDRNNPHDIRVEEGRLSR